MEVNAGPVGFEPSSGKREVQATLAPFSGMKWHNETENIALRGWFYCLHQERASVLTQPNEPGGG